MNTFFKCSTAAPNGRSSPSGPLGHLDILSVSQKIFFALYRPIVELIYGIRFQTLPLDKCLMLGCLLGVSIILRLDDWILKKGHVEFLYPSSTFFYFSYCFGMMTFPFWIWAWREVGLRTHLLKRLQEVFVISGLQNPLGTLPRFIFDQPIDGFTRKMRLHRAGLSTEQFERAKPLIESSLQVFIDEIREQRETGTIDLIYAHSPMPTIAHIENINSITPTHFVVGRTRAHQIIASLREVPHLMIAGQTGGGKSTFLRAFITTLYLNNKNIQFTLIDLKGGLEFQTFENLKRTTVIPSVEFAVSSLTETKGLLEERMALLKKYNCKDLDALSKIEDAPKLNRHIFVIDEAAEMFLAGSHAKSSEIQTARNLLSQIARQGRSVGVHLVIATQRPDSRALDPQVKANLTGVLCFQMQNDTSSILVLGNGRATELPPIAGRAIWKSGASMLEVQVPFLSIEDAETLLKPHRTSTSNAATHSQTQVSQTQTSSTSIVFTEEKSENT